MIPTRSAKPRANTRQPVLVQVHRAARTETCTNANSKGSLSHVVTNEQSRSVACGEGGETWPRCWLGASFGATFGRPHPPSAHNFCIHPPRGERAGLALSPPPINQHDHHDDQQLPNGAVRNKRAAGGLLLNFGQNCTPNASVQQGPAGLVGLSQGGRETERKRPTGPSSAGPGPQTQRPDGRPATVSILGFVVVISGSRLWRRAERHDNHHTYLHTDNNKPT